MPIDTWTITEGYQHYYIDLPFTEMRLTVTLDERGWYYIIGVAGEPRDYNELRFQNPQDAMKAGTQKIVYEFEKEMTYLKDNEPES